MPVIVFASPKGGAGKSTSAVLLATGLAERAATVTIIDADPNHPVAKWAKRPNKPETIEVVDSVTEQTIISEIEAASTRTTFVIVDLEGTASMTVSFSLSRADLVIIPMKGSYLDAAEAAKAVKLVRTQEQAFRRIIPTTMLFTQTNPAIRSRTLRSLEGQVENGPAPVMKTYLHERDAYRALFAFGGGLATLDPAEVGGLKAARTNAQAFTREVVALLKRAPAMAEVA